MPVFHDPHHTLTHLTRIALDLDLEQGRAWLRDVFEGELEEYAPVAVEVAVETRGPIGMVLNELLEKEPYTELFVELHAKLPEQSLALLEVAKTVTERLLEHYRSRRGIEARGQAANLTNDLASRLAALGLRKEALDTSRKAVRRFRRLAELEPAVFRPRLATALSSLAGHLGEVDRPRAALRATEEAEALFREIEEPSTLQRAHLAGVVLFRAKAYGELGEYVLARDVAQEALDLYRAWTDLDPGRYRPGVAAALNFLGVMQAQCGDFDASLQTTEEADRLSRQLSDQNQDAHHPFRVAVLPNLAARYREEGNVQEAARKTREAIEQYRPLAHRNPSRFKPELAASLSNLAAMEWESGEPESSVRAAREAEALYEDLALNESEFGKEHAAASLNLAIALHQLGQHHAAVKSANKAVKIYKNLARARRKRFRPKLATALCNITPMFEKVDQPREALRHARWAVRIFRSLSPLLPDPRHSFAIVLNNLSQLLDAAGRHKEALAATKEAINHCDALSDKLPATIRPTRAMILNTYANSLATNGQHEAALRAAREAVCLYQVLTQKSTRAFLPKLAVARFNLSNRYREVGNLIEAAGAALAATACYRDLAKQDAAILPDLDTAVQHLQGRIETLARDPAQHEEVLRISREAVELFRNSGTLRPQLATSLVSLGSILGKLSHHQEGLEATREGVCWYRELAQENPDVFRLPLAGSLNNLGHRLRWLHQPGEALPRLQEAVALYRQLDRDNPDSIRPQFGPCLCNLSLALRDLGRLEEALLVAEESMRFLAPLFLQSPEFFRDWMQEVEQQYRTTAEAAGSKLDPEFLQPVQQLLQKLGRRNSKQHPGKHES